MSQGKGAKTSGLDWAISIVQWADERGIDLSDSTGLFPYVPVILWARALRRPPTHQAISARWNVDRATAFRWLKRLTQVQSEASLRRWNAAADSQWTAEELAEMRREDPAPYTIDRRYQNLWKAPA